MKQVRKQTLLIAVVFVQLITLIFVNWISCAHILDVDCPRMAIYTRGWPTPFAMSPKVYFGQQYLLPYEFLSGSTQESVSSAPYAWLAGGIDIGVGALIVAVTYWFGKRSLDKRCGRFAFSLQELFMAAPLVVCILCLTTNKVCEGFIALVDTPWSFAASSFVAQFNLLMCLPVLIVAFSFLLRGLGGRRRLESLPQ